MSLYKWYSDDWGWLSANETVRWAEGPVWLHTADPPEERMLALQMSSDGFKL